jgi:hypothetical protein
VQKTNSTIVKYSFQRFSAARIFKVACIVTLYLGLSNLLVGFKSDQIVLSAIFCLLYFGNQFTRKLILGFSIFIIYWIVFDYMKAFPNYKFNIVHIKDLYDFEKQIFGIKSGNVLLTPNEFWSLHSGKFLDVLSGLFYLCWIPVPLLFAIYLFLRNKKEFLKFSMTFFVVNIIGFIVYYLYPAAPPWYTYKFGTAFHPLTPGDPAGLTRFDSITGINIFRALYTKSSNVFAAMPSLHAAYMLIVLYYGLTNKLGLINIIFALITGGIWFSAVYNNHHYILDILAGIACAIVAIVFFNWFVKNVKWADRQLKIFLKNVE